MDPSLSSIILIHPKQPPSPPSPPPPMSTVTLPQELIDHIIDLADLSDTSSRPSIKACSLVSRSFLHACRKATFSSLHFDPISGPDLAHKFCHLLESNPSLGRFVRTLRITHTGYHNLKRVFSAGLENDLCWLISGGLLERLVEVGFESDITGTGGGEDSKERWDGLSESLREAFVGLLESPPETLRSLTVSGLRGVPLGVLRLCKGVENVVLNEIDIDVGDSDEDDDDDGRGMSDSDRRTNRIRRLHLDCVFPTLLSEEDNRRLVIDLSLLEEFSIIVHYARDLDTVSEVCKMAGGSFKSLKIEESGVMPYAALPGPISLFPSTSSPSTSSSLTHLSLILYSASYPYADPTRAIASLLSPPPASSASPPSALQSLSITLQSPILTTHLQALQITEAKGWNALTSVLSAGKDFPYLRFLKVTIWFPITNAVPGGNFRVFYSAVTRDIGESVRRKLEAGLGRGGRAKIRVVVNDDEF